MYFNKYYCLYNTESYSIQSELACTYFIKGAASSPYHWNYVILNASEDSFHIFPNSLCTVIYLSRDIRKGLQGLSNAESAHMRKKSRTHFRLVESLLFNINIMEIYVAAQKSPYPHSKDHATHLCACLISRTNTC